jgi:hypothetical protein
MPFLEQYVAPLTGAAGAAGVGCLQIGFDGKSRAHCGGHIIHMDGLDLFEQFSVHYKPYTILVKNLITFT